MAKCSKCDLNEAVIYTSRLDHGQQQSEGYCIKCAFHANIAGLEELFTKAGVNESNIDELTERMNHMMAGMGSRRPEDLFRMILSSDPADMQLDILDEEGRPKEGLLPVARGQENEDERKSDTSVESDTAPSRTRERRKKFLDQFGTNLTAKAAMNGIDRIIGRQTEIARVIQILNRRNKNNPVLLGEPGVGKTAIAEGLADKIVKGEVPDKLLDQEVYLLDMTAMVAGTQFRGQFESRMKGVVDDAKKSGNVILVIDELHNIMGAGDAEGAMNAANILKPALAKGEIRVVGSTTLDEYRRFIEKDSALERRFQKVMVDEPSPEESVEILKGVKDYYEEHHFVHYSDAVLKLAVKLSDRYINDRFLPDKAIDLIDEAGSKANLENTYLTLNKLNQEKLRVLEDELDSLSTQLAAQKDDTRALSLYERQADLRSKTLRLRQEIEADEKAIHPTEITEDDIASVVWLWTGIPVQRITEDETEKLIHLEERLHERVIGQKAAVSAVARAVRRKRAGFAGLRKPASFIFVGPTGVGKTELVKALAEALFETEDAMIRLDMSEFMESHTVSKLIGSPPGYVGYDDGGQLTEKIRRKPYSVILLDEIEKAHADVYNILLQILDDGRLTDSHGRVVSFENALIVMTSNAGTTLKAHGIGFGADGRVAMEERVDTVMKQLFRPEFLNRIDEIIVFEELSQEELRQIVDLMLHDVQKKLDTESIKLVVTEEAKAALAVLGYDPKYGARPLRKVITRRIEDVLADKMLAGELKGVIGISVDVEKIDGEYRFIFDTL
ncbi:MAG TPA: ATP-dependent Clp protease ATP-binding subunit [Fastidiosipila sp.]|nr:ATP-dependent Clp protease ATP-binding subunit [Fastidiosipila sp.]